MKQNWRFWLPFVVGFSLYFCPTPAGLENNQWHYFAIFAAVIVGLVVESMPVAAVGLIGLTLAAISGFIEKDPNKALRWALSGYSESTVWLIVGAFIFSIGYRKSGLGRRIALHLVKAMGKKTIGLAYAVTLADASIAPATPSNTARSGGTIYPIVSNIPHIYGSEPGPTAKKIGTYIMWCAFAATAVTSSMFLTALAPNIAALGIAKKTIGLDIQWSQWFFGFAPLGILLLILVPLLGYLVCKPEIKESPEVPAWALGELQAMGSLSRNEKTMSVLVILAMLLWITGSNPDITLPFLGSNFINPTMVVFVIISLMLLLNVITFDDIVSEKGAWEVFFYFTSLLTLASGLNEIGFIKWLATGVSQHLDGISPTIATLLLVSLFFWIHYGFSSITSHAAAVLPVVLAVGQGIPGIDMTVLTCLCLYSLGLMGVISPFATGPAPLYYGSGYIGKTDFWKFGLIFGMVFFLGLIGIIYPWLVFLR
ncbi:DASS family sodium-coupled anion symporter [Polynucleobacter sp. UK-Gri1-W3]|jgi:citrate:succinate antiporter/L-tartrate/succinate antiporter|uniref:DASS family sodium-coupled anion symporter n=1 Tax=Polynucleobacter sp. UK-Gri1-W3 TaxID=1819737 RepID=UPI001C0D53B7|nr:DASS family sodium-coupled anion symporter [Polynucleobacter sp. UK-Gri1-W3]MBU3538445.1 DASS family sodium-coupled anion symporter [Polynucleobacter sp. UK-Gri1-W3]